MADHPRSHGWKHLVAIGGVEKITFLVATAAAPFVMFVSSFSLLLSFLVLSSGHKLRRVHGFLVAFHGIALLFKYIQICF